MVLENMKNQMAGIYRINDLNSKNKEVCYVGMTKRKIEERLTEHIHDLKYNNQTTALARANMATPIKIDSITIEEIANYEGLLNAFLFRNQEIFFVKTIKSVYMQFINL